MAGQFQRLATYVGEAPVFPLPINAVSGNGAAWAMQFTVRQKGIVGGSQVLTKTGASITYTGTTTAASWNVQLLEGDTSSIGMGEFEYSLDRIDTGFTTCIAAGPLYVEGDPRLNA